ncbi:MAG: TonB family protein [Acidithiobacillus ferrooxidans]|nr:TonB family protein [Acidithiobacillus ferrooxidans]MDD5378036.1 TonB family protein [Acidithiobacillus sp.]MDD5577084.1 TonB family protein [Acidithiobacillus sp.]
MNSLALPSSPRPPRAVVFLLALILESGILAVLAVWMRPSPLPTPVITPPMAVQLVSWPQPSATPQPTPHPPALRTTASIPRKPVPTPPKLSPRPPREAKVPVRTPHSAPSALAVTAAPSTISRMPAPVTSAAATPAIPALPPSPPAPAAETRPSIPAYAHNPAPEYPQSARWDGEEGTVLLRVLVNVSGLPKKITVVRSSGYTSLDRAAEKAVRHWRFTPGTRDGKPVAMQVEVPIRFRLTDANL